LIKNKPQATII